MLLSVNRTELLAKMVLRKRVLIFNIAVREKLASYIVLTRRKKQKCGENYKVRYLRSLTEQYHNDRLKQDHIGEGGCSSHVEK